MFRRALAALAVCAALGAPAAAHGACVLRKVMSLPVTMVGAQPAVEVKLDGKAVRLEADSGAFFSVLSPAAASELGLKLEPLPVDARIMGLGGQAVDMRMTRVRTFGFGGAEVPDVQFLVGGGSLQGGQGIVGVLGRNVLAFGDAEYDLAHGQINLFKPKDCGGRNLGYWSPSPNTMEMARLDRDNSTTGFVKVNGATLRVLFDTGAGASMLTLSGARRAGLDVHGAGAQAAGVTTGIGRRLIRTWLVPVAEIRIGDEIIKSTKVRVADYDAGWADMLIGADFFLSHHVYVANEQQKIYFTYNGGPVFDLAVKSSAPPPEPTPVAIAAGATPGAAAPAPSPDEPKDAEGYSRRGQAYAARSDYARALADLSRAVELDGRNPHYLRERAELRLATRQPFLAMNDLDAELKLTPDDAEAHLMRAALRASGRDRAGELADLDAADRAAPKQADLRLRLGGLLTGVDENERAVGQFDQWLAFHEGDSRQATALNGRCWARARAGRDLDGALRDCDAALRLQPRTAAFLDSRGLVQLKRGDLARARADYDAALAIQPKAPLALYARGVIKTRTGDAAGGQSDIAAATALNAQVAETARRAGLAP